MKISDKVLWIAWLLLVGLMLVVNVGLMLVVNDKQKMEIQRLNGVVYELRMERSEWLHNIQVMEARVASVELREE